MCGDSQAGREDEEESEDRVEELHGVEAVATLGDWAKNEEEQRFCIVLAVAE